MSSASEFFITAVLFVVAAIANYMILLGLYGIIVSLFNKKIGCNHEAKYIKSVWNPKKKSYKNVCQKCGNETEFIPINLRGKKVLSI